MKNLLAVVSLPLVFTFALSDASALSKCAVTLDAPIKTVAVEQQHVVDICLPANFDRLVLGDAVNWDVSFADDKTMLYIRARVSNGGTNALVYLKDEQAARHEIRLRATEMRPQ